MKIKAFEAAALSRALAPIDLEKAQDVSDLVVDLFLAVWPTAKEYESALAAFQKDAQGKTPEEAKKLVSAQAFEKLANGTVDIDMGLDTGQIKNIGRHFRSVADIALLYNLKK